MTKVEMIIAAVKAHDFTYMELAEIVDCLNEMKKEMFKIQTMGVCHGRRRNEVRGIHDQFKSKRARAVYAQDGCRIRIVGKLRRRNKPARNGKRLEAI